MKEFSNFLNVIFIVNIFDPITFERVIKCFKSLDGAKSFASEYFHKSNIIIKIHKTVVFD